MKMVDGVLLVVDAHDGPQAQTRFVLRKALENKAKPIVVINKVDRENARPHKVLDMVFDLFVELKATDQQLDFRVLYASAKNGFALRELHENNEDMTPLFEAIVNHVPPPTISADPFFQMLVSNLDYSDYLGRIALGRIVSGRVNVGDSIVCIHRNGERERATVTTLFTYSGLERVEIKHASAGDIIGLTGFEEIFIAEILTDREERAPLQFVAMDHHANRVSREAVIPTRGLIGFETDLVNLTRGEGLMSHLFREYAPFKGEIEGRNRGVMISMEPGTSTAYALNNIQARGKLFVGPQEEIYTGMIVGENARPEDLPVNPCKAKHLTNMRSQGEGKGIQLEAPLKMTLERAIEYIDIDEYVEATPKSLRLRKRILGATARKRAIVMAA